MCRSQQAGGAAWGRCVGAVPSASPSLLCYNPSPEMWDGKADTRFWEHTSHSQCEHCIELGPAHSGCLLTHSLESPIPLPRGTRDLLGPSCWVWHAGILLGLSGSRKLPTKPGVNEQVPTVQGRLVRAWRAAGGVRIRSRAPRSRTLGLHRTHSENQGGRGTSFSLAWPARCLGSPAPALCGRLEACSLPGRGAAGQRGCWLAQKPAWALGALDSELLASQAAPW